MADNTGDERLEIGGGRYDQIMTRLRPDTRRSMPDLNDVFTTKRGIGSSGPEMEKEEEKFCPTEIYSVSILLKLKDFKQSCNVEILG